MIDPRIPQGLGPQRQRILEVALAELDAGVREKPRGSNRGERIDVYVPAWARRGRRGPPWCAFFVSWVLAAALGRVPTGQRRGGCAALTRDARREELWRGRDYVPVPGDLFLLDTDGSRGSKGHVGIVLRVSADGERYETVEGNSGHAVRLGRRERTDLELAGFVCTVPAEPCPGFERGLVGGFELEQLSTR